MLSFPQKVGLWLQFLENGIDYEEFAWLYDRISAQELHGRIEWELAVYAALNQLEYALKISKSVFELYDGGGERRYFSFNSEQNPYYDQIHRTGRSGHPFCYRQGDRKGNR